MLGGATEDAPPVEVASDSVDRVAPEGAKPTEVASDTVTRAAAADVPGGSGLTGPVTELRRPGGLRPVVWIWCGDLVTVAGEMSPRNMYSIYHVVVSVFVVETNRTERNRTVNHSRVRVVVR